MDCLISQIRIVCRLWSVGRLPDVRWVYGLSDLSGGCMDCLISQVGVWTVLTYRQWSVK